MQAPQGQDPKGWRVFHLCFFGFFVFHGAHTALYLGWPAALDVLLASVFVGLYINEKDTPCADS